MLRLDSHCVSLHGGGLQREGWASEIWVLVECCPFFLFARKSRIHPLSSDNHLLGKLTKWYHYEELLLCISDWDQCIEAASYLWKIGQFGPTDQIWQGTINVNSWSVGICDIIRMIFTKFTSHFDINLYFQRIPVKAYRVVRCETIDGIFKVAFLPTFCPIRNPLFCVMKGTIGTVTLGILL